MCGLYSLYVSDNYCVNGPVFGRPVVYRFGCCFLLNIVGEYLRMENSLRPTTFQSTIQVA